MKRIVLAVVGTLAFVMVASVAFEDAISHMTPPPAPSASDCLTGPNYDAARCDEAVREAFPRSFASPSPLPTPDEKRHDMTVRR